jgi:hypothetical protein
MANEQDQLREATLEAACEIAGVFDRMFDCIPAGADLRLVAASLITGLESTGAHPRFIKSFSDALVAPLIKVTGGQNPMRRFHARQILIDMRDAEMPVLRIETDTDPVMVWTERSVLEQFFAQAEPTRLSLRPTPMNWDEIDAPSNDKPKFPK